jgi:hypothetical protein
LPRRYYYGDNHVQIIFNHCDLSLKELLSIDSLDGLKTYRTESASVIFADLPLKKWRLVIRLAPLGYAWGMAPDHSRFSAALPSPDESTAFISELALEAGVTDEKIRQSIVLNSLGYFPENDQPQQYWFWGNGIDSSDESWAYYCTTLESFQSQLEQFCLLRDGDPSDEDSIEKIDPLMSLLFINEPGRDLLNAAAENEVIEKIEAYADTPQTENLQTRLSPAFLNRSPTINFPLPRTATIPRKADILQLFAKLVEDPVSQNELRKQKSLARVRLLRKLGWPIGIPALLAKQEAAYRQFTLKNEQPFVALEEEVEAYLREGKEKYPIDLAPEKRISY